MAESFGTDAGLYDRTRPRYPDELVDRIVGGRRGLQVLDVGMGTGIVARQLQAAGCVVLGVEPDERMAAFARRTGCVVEVATIEAWEPAGRVFDAVVSGQAWHWVDPVAGAVQAARVLRPGGRLAVFWNAAQPPPELAEAFGDVYRRVLPQSPMTAGVDSKLTAAEMYALMAGKAADGMRAAGGFGAVEQWRFEWEQAYSRDEWLAQVTTQGGQSQVPARVREELLEGLGAAIGDGFTMHYTTVVATAVREVPLVGGFVGAAVRVGDTVRKAPPPDPGFVRGLLTTFAGLGWAGAPRFLGTDEQGREVLSFVEGDVPSGPVSDEALAAVARLVREFHDLTGGVVCHHDLSPGNTVFRDGMPVAFIDWDLAGPGLPVQDLAHVCWQFVPLGPGADVAEAARRVRVVADAYGWVDLPLLVETVLWWQDRCWRGIAAGADDGVPAMVRLRDAGVVESVRAAYAWTLERRAELSR
ncbi:type 11 methyltransferase [Actinoplanes friuliensis DSM 7358]|uniref:Type 11 methyltransferase n=1 Tax=Actinoplanes friuliensis DSM 7358 TaxID=1246995 RepID=U5W3S8_9ACTN|nr:type 11 methyltransferase [Actinoplanes friuliensis DSM 7358]